MNWKHLTLTFLIVLATTTARPSDTAPTNDKPSEADKQSAIRTALLSRRYLQPNLYSTDSINTLDPIFVEYKDSSNHVINDFLKKSIPFLLHGTSRSFTNFPKKSKLNSTKPIVNKLSILKTKPPDDDNQESRYGVSPYQDRLSYFEYHQPPAAEVNIASNSGAHYYSQHYPSAAVSYKPKPSLVTIPAQANYPTTFYQEVQSTSSSRPPLPPPFSTRPYLQIPRPIKTQTEVLYQKPVTKPTLLISSRPTPLEYQPIKDIYVTTERPPLYAHRPTYNAIDSNSYPIRKNNASSYTNFLTETYNGYDYIQPPTFIDLQQQQAFTELSPESAEYVYLNNTLHILKKPVLLGSADPEDPDPFFLPGYNSSPVGPSGYGDIVVEDARNATGELKKCSKVKITVTDSVSFQVNQDPCEDDINVTVTNGTKSAIAVSSESSVEDKVGKKSNKKQKFRIKKKRQKLKKKKKEPTPIDLTLHNPKPQLVPVLAQVQQPHLDYHYDPYEHEEDDHGVVYQTVTAPGKHKRKKKKRKRKHKPDDEQSTYIIKKPEYSIFKKPHKKDKFYHLLFQVMKYVPVVLLALLNPMTLLLKALIFIPFKFFFFGTAGLAFLLYPLLKSSDHTQKKTIRSHKGFTIRHDHRHKFLSKPQQWSPPQHWSPPHKETHVYHPPKWSSHPKWQQY